MTRAKSAYTYWPTLKLLEERGIQWMRVHKYNGPKWTGEMFIFTDDDDDGSIWHELCHWLVAQPFHRNRVNFGLGPDANMYGHAEEFFSPKWEFGDLENSVGKTEADRAETLATNATYLYPSVVKGTHTTLHQKREMVKQQANEYNAQTIDAVIPSERQAQKDELQQGWRLVLEALDIPADQFNRIEDEAMKLVPKGSLT